MSQTVMEFDTKVKERTWSVWPPDKLQFAINCIKKLWPKRHTGTVDYQIRTQIKIIRMINSGETKRYQ